MPSSSGLSVKGLAKSYSGGRKSVLVDVHLEVPSGGAFGLIGPNGSGKTTLMGCLLGLLKPDAGVIHIDGMSPEDMRAKAKIGYVPERIRFEPWMTGLQVMELHQGLAGVPNSPQELRDLLVKVGLAEQAWDRQVRTYSRGMLQRLALAQALVGKPSFLFLDEPTSGMDPTGVLDVRHILEEAQAGGMTILLNSHQLDQVGKSCQGVAFLKDGRLEAMSMAEAGAGLRHVVRLRFGAKAPKAKDLEHVLKSVGASLVPGALPEPKFRVEVADDATTAELVRVLAKKGWDLVEMAPEQDQLERLFLNRTPEGQP